MGTLDTKEFAPLAGEAKAKQLAEIAAKYKGNAKVAQRSRLLSALRLVPVSTFEARKYLDVMHPAGRVRELRRCDWLIDTVWIAAKSDCGKAHRTALYVLRGRNDE